MLANGRISDFDGWRMVDRTVLYVDEGGGSGVRMSVDHLFAFVLCHGPWSTVTHGDNDCFYLDIYRISLIVRLSAVLTIMD